MKAVTHFTLSDTDFEIQFANCSLDPELFIHEAHLRLAWIHITKYGLNEAEKNICEQIKRFDKTFGIGMKFHVTLTIASVKMINHFIRKSESDNFVDFMKEFPRLKSNFRELISAHYSTDIFTDLYAKNKYLEPELKDF